MDLTTLPASSLDGVLSAAGTALRRYARADSGHATDGTHDAGPALLAALTAQAGLEEPELTRRVLERWLNTQPDGAPHQVGAFGGLAGLFAGLRAAGPLQPPLRPLARLVAESLAAWSSSGALRLDRVGWIDYDLINGPAGVVLCLAGTEHTAQSLPAARHLAALCDRPDLHRLRLHEAIDPRSAWNLGRINTGLGHGVAGVAAALRAAAETATTRPEDFTAPLRHVCDWLVAQSYVDDQGLTTWPPAGLDGTPPSRRPTRRQAWCYGTPGIAWTLWDAGRVLADETLTGFARQAMQSFCEAFDEHRHLDPDPVDAALTVCHGAAGTLALADAFARHASLPAAAALRGRLTAYLTERLPDVKELAMLDLSVLNGATGIFAALLSTAATERPWLAQLALR